MCFTLFVEADPDVFSWRRFFREPAKSGAGCLHLTRKRLQEALESNFSQLIWLWKQLVVSVQRMSIQGMFEIFPEWML